MNRQGEILKMLNKRQKLGKEGERLVHGALKKAGYRILARNYRVKFGEIDIIAEKGDTTVFMEVKARRGKDFGLPKESVTLTKQKKISMTALCYLKESGRGNTRARFDVASVIYGENGPELEILENAFELVHQ